MEKLHLSMNVLTGTVSSSIHLMTNLKELMLSRTYIAGTIPEKIGNLVALENLEMYGNQLTGKIPDSLGSCTNLKRIGKYDDQSNITIRIIVCISFVSLNIKSHFTLLFLSMIKKKILNNKSRSLQ
jgi:hypothetical protein